MKKTLLLIAALSFIFWSCSDDSDLNGFYIGIKENQTSNTHDLIFFKKDSLIDYFRGINDGCEFSTKGDVLSFECKYGENFKRRIVNNGDTITFYPVVSKSKALSYKRSSESNYLFDYTHERLEIELPIGKGEIKSLRRDYQFKNPLYLYKSEGELMVNFMNKTVKLNESFHNLIGDFRNSVSISIIAEKSLTMVEMKELFDQLKLSGRLRVDYMLRHSEYDEVNFVSSVLRPMTQEEFVKFSHLNIPPPPPFVRPKISTEELRNNGVLFDFSNNSEESLEHFKKELKTRIQTDSNTLILYHLADNSTYDDYISFLVTAKNTCLDLRDDYLMKKYGKTYRELMNGNDEREMLVEARRKFPYGIIEIDSTELKEIKQGL